MRSIVTALAFLGAASAIGMRRRLVPPPVGDEELYNVNGLSEQVFLPINSSGGTPYWNRTFDQLIDHKNPELGTFRQRYWVSDRFWKNPGGPVVLMTPGESEASDYMAYLTETRVTGLYAKAVGAAVIVIEHRYWGTSSPTNNLTTANMKYLTIEQAVEDMTYFAENVHLPFDLSGTSSPDKAPWIFVGGSYSGALVAWTQSLKPGYFWAYHATSAVVEAIADFWLYYEPIRQNMPQNCSSDVQRVVEYVDDVLIHGKRSEKNALKAKFGLETVEHDDDFASALTSAVGTWQEDDFTTGYSKFYQFCDYVENAVPEVFPNAGEPSAKGVGLTAALHGYALWMKTILLPDYCEENFGYFKGKNNMECFDSHDPKSPIYTDTNLNNTANRSWMWMLCNEPLEFWQTAAPRDQPSLLSRLLDAQYFRRQCALYFPAENGVQPGIETGATEDQVNARTRGWFLTDTERMLWVNGQRDPWLEATVSSSVRPGGPLQSTEKNPVIMIPGGVHCSDLDATNGAANEGVKEILDNEVRIMKRWVDEFYERIPAIDGEL